MNKKIEDVIKLCYGIDEKIDTNSSFEHNIDKSLRGIRVVIRYTGIDLDLFVNNDCSITEDCSSIQGDLDRELYRILEDKTINGKSFRLRGVSTSSLDFLIIDTIDDLIFI